MSDQAASARGMPTFRSSSRYFPLYKSPNLTDTSPLHLVDLSLWQISSSTDTTYMFGRACVMEPKNLPLLQDPKRDYILERACTACPHCPPNGGPCLHGFSRELSLMCAMCPQDKTEIGGSCQTCPSNALLINNNRTLSRSLTYHLYSLSALSCFSSRRGGQTAFLSSSSTSER